MKLDGWEAELFGDFGIFYFAGLFNGQTHDALCHVRTRGNSRTTTKGLELDVLDNTVVVHSDLKLHNISAPAELMKYGEKKENSG